ncbi:MAG: flagellar assembly protein FliW [Wolinella sp.]
MEFEVKSPILGFEWVKSVKLEKIDDMFMKLRNANADSPAFTLVNPFLLREYDFEVPLSLKLLLDLKDNTNLLVLNIMIIHTPLESSTVNFLAPVIFNFDNKTMGQVVLENHRYPNYGLAEVISSFFDESATTQDSDIK